MFTVPFWASYIFISLLILLLFGLWGATEAEKNADKMAFYSFATIKSLMLSSKQHNVYVANCYFDQADDVSLHLEPDKNGVMIVLSKKYT